jgi:hypothetical protein
MLKTQKLYHCDPHFKTISKIGHNPYFRPTVKILFFGGFGKHLWADAAERLLATR